MDEKKFDDIMERWAEREQSSTPRLHPTRDMYTLLKSRRRISWYPVTARWVTVGVAAAVIVVVAIVHPSMVPIPFFQGEKANQEALDEEPYTQEAHNEAKDVDVSPEQDMTRGLSVADKEKQVLVKKSDDAAEPAGMPADALQFADEEQIAEPLAARPAPVSEGFVKAPAEPPSVGEKQPKSRAVTEFGMARSKTASRREQKDFDTDRKDELEEKQEKPPPANLVPGDPIDAVADCTPLPDTSFASPAGSATVGRSSGSPAMLTETSEDAEPEISTLFQTPNSPKICIIQMAEMTIGAKTFRLQEHTWIDTAYDEALERLVIQRDSPAYAELLQLLPDMYTYAESGNHILVSLETIAIEIAPEGQTQLTDADVRVLKSLGRERG